MYVALAVVRACSLSVVHVWVSAQVDVVCFAARYSTCGKSPSSASMADGARPRRSLYLGMASQGGALCPLSYHLWSSVAPKPTGRKRLQAIAPNRKKGEQSSEKLASRTRLRSVVAYLPSWDGNRSRFTLVE
jgi:hypothetical protein